jgi:hypothetical protein
VVHDDVGQSGAAGVTHVGLRGLGCHWDSGPEPGREGEGRED